MKKIKKNDEWICYGNNFEITLNGEMKINEVEILSGSEVVARSIGIRKVDENTSIIEIQFLKKPKLDQSLMFIRYEDGTEMVKSCKIRFPDVKQELDDPNYFICIDAEFTNDTIDLTKNKKIHGWIVHKSEYIEGINVQSAGIQNKAIYGLRRDDVHAIYPLNKNKDCVGFVVDVENTIEECGYLNFSVTAEKDCCNFSIKYKQKLQTKKVDDEHFYGRHLKNLLVHREAVKVGLLCEDMTEKGRLKECIDKIKKFEVSNYQMELVGAKNHPDDFDVIFACSSDDVLAPTVYTLIDDFLSENFIHPLAYYDENVCRKYFCIYFRKPGFDTTLFEHNDYIRGRFLAKGERKAALLNSWKNNESFYSFLLKYQSDIDSINTVGVLTFDTKKTDSKSEKLNTVKKYILSKYTDVVEDVEVGEKEFTQSFRMKEQNDSVAIIIPTIFTRDLIFKCIESIRKNLRGNRIEIVVLDHSQGKEESKTKRLLELTDKVIQVRGPFNWSKFNNYGAYLTTSKYLLFLNDDTEILSENWLNQLIGYSKIYNNAILTGTAYYQNGLIQSHGVSIIKSDAIAKNDFNLSSRGDECFFGIGNSTKTSHSLLGAMLLVNRKVFLEIGGFDENLPIEKNELSFCLSALRKNYISIVTESAGFLHHEKVSRNSLKNNEEQNKYFIEKYGDVYFTVDKKNNSYIDDESPIYRSASEPIVVHKPRRTLYNASNVKNILILKLDHIGDLITIIPAIKNIRKSFPNAKITGCVGEWGKNLAEELNLFDSTLVLNYFKEVSSAGVSDNEISIPCDIIYDLAIDFRADPETRHVLLKFPAALYSGFTVKNYFDSLDISLEYEYNIKQFKKSVSMEERLDQLVAIIKTKFTDSVRHTGVVEQRDPYRTNLNRYCVIHPFAGNKIKQWPLEYYLLISQYLYQNYKIASRYIGSKKDFSNVKISLNSEYISIEDTANWSDTIKVITGSDLFIGNDSGPYHLSQKFNIPTIGIFFSGNAVKQWSGESEYKRAYTIFTETKCSPCYISKESECAFDLKCMKKIYPSDIINVINSILY